MTGADDTTWPGALAEIAEVAGDEAAAALATTVGGTRIWIPASAEPGTQLVELVGRQAAEAIVARFGVGPLLVPLGPASTHARQRRQIRALLAKGWSHQKIARALSCHVRTVERVANAGAPGDPRQMDLLDRAR